jgi:hypothetical protein
VADGLSRNAKKIIIDLASNQARHERRIMQDTLRGFEALDLKVVKF